LSAIITVAPTGPVATKSDNPTLPTQPDEIAAAVEGAYQLGASIAHIHLRDEQDRPTSDLNQLSFLVSGRHRRRHDRRRGANGTTTPRPGKSKRQLDTQPEKNRVGACIPATEVPQGVRRGLNPRVRAA
jgi:uncharacterized protein (DUF849 family)